MEVFKVILWKEIKKEIGSLKKQLGYITILFIALYNYKINKLLIQEILSIGYGICIVSFMYSKNFYKNISTLLSLPISIKEYCIYRNLCNCIKLFTWELINLLFLLFIYNDLIMASINIKFFITLILYHIYIIQVMLISEYLLIRFGQKYLYFILLLSSILIIIMQIILISNIILFNFIAQLCIFATTLCIYRKLTQLNNERIIGRWI
jgi:hypothetical protein